VKVRKERERVHHLIYREKGNLWREGEEGEGKERRREREKKGKREKEKGVERDRQTGFVQKGRGSKIIKFT